MKKLLNLFLAICVIGLLSHCGGDDPGPSDDNDDTTEPPMTPEENKENLQAIGVDFVQEMALLQETATSQSLISFGLLVDESTLWQDEEEGGRVGPAVKDITRRILAVSYQKLSTSDFARISQEDPETLEELWESEKGVYDWNASLNDFEFTAGGEVIQFNFPDTEDGTSNNVSLTVREYTGVTISNPIEEDYVGDLPATFRMDMFVDDTKEMEYSFEIEYTNEGEPEMIETTLFMNPFELSVGLTNTEVKVGTSVSFANGNKVLIAVSTEVNGNFDDETIEGAEESEDPSEVVTDATASVTLLDLKITASMDFASLYNEIGELETYYYEGDGGTEPDLEGNADLIEEALNAYAPLTTSYVSTNTLAASAEWYTYVEVDAEYGEKYIELGARMVFADGSKVDIEDYFAAGFSELESEINDLIDAIGNDIGEDLDHIDFD